jgi:hypothetical protein
MYFCNRCNAVSKGSPEIQFEKVNEQVAENLLLDEKGKYVCGRCRNTIAEYKVFVKIDENFKNSEREKEDKIWAAFQASKPLEQDVVPQHNAPSTNILEVIALLEGLRAKYRNEALSSSHSLSQKHRHVEAHEDIRAVDAYISMCKGVFEHDNKHFQDALGHLDVGKESIPTSAYPLTLLCQSFLENGNFEKLKKIEAAKRASLTMKEELAKEIFELILDESEIESLRSSAGREDRIKYFVEKEHENDEDRYDQVFDQAALDRAEDRFRSHLKEAVARSERTFYALMGTLKSRNPYG